MNIGKKFEQTIYKSWEKCGLDVIRLRLTDSMAERPCDDLIIGKESTLFIELKSTSKARFDFRNIGTHQIRCLKYLHGKHGGTYGLFFIEFTQHDKMVAISIPTLLDFIREGQTSAPLEELEEVGIVLSKEGDYYPVQDIYNEVRTVWNN